ncbi:MAG: adenylate/guanylate cyclase domain-containing protein, partial [Mesorhizobium sp.]
MTALLLMAVISTAASVHVIWERTATRNVEKIVASLDAQSADSIRSELTSTLAVVAGTAEIIRSILFQGTIKADDEVKREFLFLALLR